MLGAQVFMDGQKPEARGISRPEQHTAVAHRSAALHGTLTLSLSPMFIMKQLHRFKNEKLSQISIAAAETGAATRRIQQTWYGSCRGESWILQGRVSKPSERGTGGRASKAPRSLVRVPPLLVPQFKHCISPTAECMPAPPRSDTTRIGYMPG